MAYPITLGSGKRLLADGNSPLAFKVMDSQIISNGVMVVNHERAGTVTTRS